MFDRRLLVNFDGWLFIAVFLVAALGLVNLYSICSSSWEASSVYFYRQLYWVALGLIVIFCIIPVNYMSIIRYSYYLHALALLFLLVVIFLGKTKLGSQRWLSLGPINVQPSEIAKISFILALCKFYFENSTAKPFRLLELLVPFFFLVLTFFLIYIQPDLGTGGIIVLVFCSLLFFVRVDKKSIAVCALSALLLLPLLWSFLRDYQKKRVLTFLNPELDPLHSGYQIIQSKIAIGSGGFWGKGFTRGTQSQLRFLPEQHTDFAFSVWGEEWGFLGCVVLLLLFFIILYRGLGIAFNSKNFSGSLLGICIVFLLFWQIIINLGMTIGLFPVVGVPLPFFSYGGSSMLSSMFAVGLLLNIGMRRFKYQR
jgi:rod shape determining protein RodA